jgi:hypothetical protein
MTTPRDIRSENADMSNDKSCEKMIAKSSRVFAFVNLQHDYESFLFFNNLLA